MDLWHFKRVRAAQTPRESARATRAAREWPPVARAWLARGTISCGDVRGDCPWRGVLSTFEDMCLKMLSIVSDGLTCRVYPQNHAGRGEVTRSGAMAAARLYPNIRVLIVSDGLTCACVRRLSARAAHGRAPGCGEAEARLATDARHGDSRASSSSLEPLSVTMSMRMAGGRRGLRGALCIKLV